MKTKSIRGIWGFSLVEAILLTVIVAVLVAIFLPQFARPRHRRNPRIQCVNNEKQLGIAFRGFGMGWDGFPMTARTNKPLPQIELIN